MNYNGTYYYYVTDLQGDVVAIVDTAGVKVVEYLYDAWGRLLETSGTKAADLGVHNPLRYRGYVYDPETGLYYLQSRYYNPTLGRFLSSDVIYDTDAGLQGFNLFLYCGNNPTNRVDATGKDSKDLIDGDKEDDNYHDHSGGHGGGNGQPGTGNVSSNGQVSGHSGGNSSSNDGLFLPDEFYQKNAPLQSTPNDTITHYKYNKHTNQYEKSTVYYDDAGRQVMRIDWTNHGRIDHGDPHIHFRVYSARFRDGRSLRMD